jgi:hypothetical protein
MELTAHAPPLVGGRAHATSAPDSGVTRPDLELLWDSHGASAYALACALLGDERAAAEAVRLAMADIVQSTHGASNQDVRRRLVRHVYRHAQDSTARTSDPTSLPPVMVWVSQLARLQRASLALCVFGGLTYQEAAALLDVPPSTVADLLTTGLREAARLATGATASCA